MTKSALRARVAELEGQLAVLSWDARALDGTTLLTAEGPGTVEPSAPSPRVVLRFERPTARHPMWWTDEPFHLYRVTLEAAGPAGAPAIPIRVAPLADRPSLR